jgi:hypothetical protein
MEIDSIDLHAIFQCTTYSALFYLLRYNINVVLSAFRPPGGGVPGPTSKIVAACLSPDGLARDGTQRGGNRGSCYPAPEEDALAVGVTNVRA